LFFDGLLLNWFGGSFSHTLLWVKGSSCDTVLRVRKTFYLQFAWSIAEVSGKVRRRWRKVALNGREGVMVLQEFLRGGGGRLCPVLLFRCCVLTGSLGGVLSFRSEKNLAGGICFGGLGFAFCWNVFRRGLLVWLGECRCL